MPFGPAPSLTIFPQEPPANQDTFNHGLPAKSDADENLAIILFSPNLRNLVAMDNTGSAATSHYEQDVTHGFSFSSTQGLSISQSVGVNIEVVTASVTTEFSITFTEEWSKETTEIMAFDCPPNEKTFVYQGSLMARLLKFDVASGSFSYLGETTTTLTRVIKTTATPILTPDPNAHIA